MAENSADQNALAQGRVFVWHEVYSPNREKMLDFYTNALGFGVQEMPMGEMGNYTMLTKNGAPVCGVMATEGNPHMEGVPPHWSTYLSVDDLDASLASCKEHGAQVVVEAMDVPSVGRMALIQDPQGAHIWLFKSA